MDDESRLILVAVIKLGLVISMLGLTFSILDIITTPQGGDLEDGDE